MFSFFSILKLSSAVDLYEKYASLKAKNAPFLLACHIYRNIHQLYDTYMDNQRPFLITSEEKVKSPILIVDKKGFIGNALTKLLRDQFLVVIVTAGDVEHNDNVIQIPYRRKVPLIPDNAYSHIFIVFNGETELLDMLTSFEKKAEAVKARLLFITSLLHSTPKLFSRLRRPGFSLLQIVLYGETFENMITEANETNFFIHQVRVYGRIEVPGQGLGKLYPIFFDDVLSSVVTLAFAIEKPKDTIFLFPHHDFNEITVARMIQKIDPTIKIDFTKRKSSARSFYVPQGLYFFRNYTLEEKLHRIDFSRVGRRSKIPQKKIKLSVPDYEAKRNRITLLWATALAVFIAPIMLAFLCSLCGAGFLTFSTKLLTEGNLQSAQTSTEAAQISFATAQVLGPSLLIPQFLLPAQKEQFMEMMQTGQTVSMTEGAFIRAVQTMKNIYEKKSLNPKDDFSQSVATIKNSLVTMQKLEAERSLPQPIIQKLHSLDDEINLVEETIDIWPNIFGFSGKKTYLILFQNNMELRPGGGFIGSYGLLPVENGVAGKLQIQDVYDADGQLKEPIQPPYGLQRYLGVSHWFLRDSNFDPDFSVDARQASFFLQKETGQKVDGVIAINTTFLQDLLRVVGSVEVPDYTVTVTPDNFYLLTETHAEKNFFPGSTQKKDFLRSLTNALLNRFSSGKQISYERMAQVIVTALQQKDIAVAFSDPGVQNVFTVNDLSSSLWDGRAVEKNTAYDYFGIVDANVGVNKANYYIKRSIGQSTSLSNIGELQTTVDVTYTNTSLSTSAFGGDYKDYVRFLVPANATLLSIAFDRKTEQITPAVTDPALFSAPDFTPPSGLEVDQTTTEGKSTIGFFFIVPQGTSRTITVTYRSPSGIDPSAVAFSYNVHLFKQSGAGNDPYELSLSYPNNVTVLVSDNGFTNVGGKLIYDGQLSQDRDIRARFSKKQ